jgi:hypothetical protein
MGLLDRLLGKKSTQPEGSVVEVAERPVSSLREVVDARDESKLPPHSVLLGGQGRVEVRGESHYQEALDEICGGKCTEGHGRKVYAILHAEPDNPYDPNAIAIYVEEKMVGYMAKESAAEYAPIARILTDKGRIGVARAFIRGGWRRPGGDEGNYGIELELSPTEKLLKARKITNLLND